MSSFVVTFRPVPLYDTNALLIFLLPSDGRLELYTKYVCPKTTQQRRSPVSSEKVPGSVTSDEMQSEL